MASMPRQGQRTLILYSEKDLRQEVRVPAAGAALHNQTYFLIGVLFEQSQGEATTPGEVLGDVSFAYAALVFAERHIQGPVTSILDAPVAAHRASEQFHVSFQADDVELHFTGFLPVDLACANDHAQSLQAGPVLPARQRFRHVNL